jgi:hypothetical protein
MGSFSSKQVPSYSAFARTSDGSLVQKGADLRISAGTAQTCRGQDMSLDWRVDKYLLGDLDDRPVRPAQMFAVPAPGSQAGNHLDMVMMRLLLEFPPYQSHPALPSRRRFCA